VSEPRIVDGYCVAATFALERIKYGNGGGDDFPNPRSKMVRAVKVTHGALATSNTATTPCGLRAGSSFWAHDFRLKSSRMTPGGTG
jgi:hypothetical protein